MLNLLLIVVYLLQVEAIKGNTKPSEVNMEELVGNTDGFADSG